MDDVELIMGKSKQIIGRLFAVALVNTIWQVGTEVAESEMKPEHQEHLDHLIRTGVLVEVNPVEEIPERLPLSAATVLAVVDRMEGASSRHENVGDDWVVIVSNNSKLTIAPKPEASELLTSEKSGPEVETNPAQVFVAKVDTADLTFTKRVDGEKVTYKVTDSENKSTYVDRLSKENLEKVADAISLEGDARSKEGLMLWIDNNALEQDAE